MKIVKRLIIIFLLLGMILIGTAYALGLDNPYIGTFGNSSKYTEQEVKIDSNINSIDLDIRVQDVKITKTDFDITTLTYMKADNNKHKFEVNESQGKISVKESWTGLGIFNFTPISFFDKSHSVELELGKNIDLSDFNIKVDVGKIDISGLSSNSGSIKVDTGDVKISDSNISNMDISCDVGSISMENVNLKDTKLSADVGDIRANIEALGKLDFSADTGSIKVTTSNDDYGYKLEADLGSINVNGTSYKGNAERNSEKTDSLVNIKAAIGSIELNNK